jgi:N-acetylmuramoyl-L-alanine amidase
MSVGCYDLSVLDAPSPRVCGSRLRSVSRRKAVKHVGVALLTASLAPAAFFDAPKVSAASLAGMAVFLDPGHNGVYDSSITRQVTNGRGGTKQCNTTGTATNDGYPEHAVNWDIALRVRDALNQMGARTQLSRGDDNSVGPCVDQRAALANAMHPDAIVSIHADGGPASGRGFHVNYSSPPLNDAQGGPAVQLAHVMRDSLLAAGLGPSTYIGSEGLYGRADLAGLNLAEYPAVLVELGNMNNGDDAARMQSADGRAKYAAAVTDGIVAYLGGKASGS